MEFLPPETDCPYLAPVRGERNEPANVVGITKLLAELRGWTEEKAQQQVWQNYHRLFKAQSTAAQCHRED